MRMHTRLRQEEGVIIWGFTNEDIPGDVYFLPVQLKQDETFIDLLHRVFSDQKSILYDMIFSPMKVNIPRLADIMDSMDFIPATYADFNKEIKIGYGRITFNLNMVSNDDFPPRSEIRNISIVVNEKLYNLKLQQMPNERGFAVLFEKLSINMDS